MLVGSNFFVLGRAVSPFKLGLSWDTMPNRREFLRYALQTGAVEALPRASRGRASAAEPISVRLRHESPTILAANFIGLGYEKSSAAMPGLLSAQNKDYVQLIKNLGAKGVLRIGGIVADFSRYDPDGRSVAEPKNTIITRSNLEQLSVFLKKTGWSAIWSLNFGRGSIADALVEATDVARILGPCLDAVELGNEVENYGNGTTPLRSAPYTYETYRAEYEMWHRAITKAIPALRFAAPDTAGSVEWVERMAKDAADRVQLLTTHYYRGGQKQGSSDQLTYPDPGLTLKLARLARASQASGIPWRMCETNSFFGGGLPGVSNTLLGALWTLDYMMLLAQSGCAGVNLETGVNQLGFVSSYSPIQDNGSGINSAGVPYYGMLAFATAVSGCAEMLAVDFDSRGINLTGYACGAGRRIQSIVLVNRDKTQDASLSIGELGMGEMIAYRLLSDSPNSEEGVTFGNSSIDPEGKWAPQKPEYIRDARLRVPRMSAIVLRSMHPHLD